MEFNEIRKEANNKVLENSSATSSNEVPTNFRTCIITSSVYIKKLIKSYYSKFM